MAVSVGLIAQTIFNYFKEHDEEFEAYLLEHCEVDEGTATWQEDRTGKCLVLRITRMGQDGEKLAEDEYSLKLTKIKGF
jgi:hypothetical protein